MTSLTAGTNDYLRRVGGLNLSRESKEAIVETVMRNPEIVKNYMVELGKESGVTMGSYAANCERYKSLLASATASIRELESEVRQLKSKCKHYENLLDYDKI